MEAVIFCGVQASGKTAFYRERFFNTHLRLNLDMLKDRGREDILLDACFRARQRFVIDNTNPTREDRQRYVRPAQRAGFRVVGYYFGSTSREAIARNRHRKESERVPVPALLKTYARLQVPTVEEGFGTLFRVRVGPEGKFTVERIEPSADDATGSG